MKHPLLVVVLALALLPAVPQAAGPGPAEVVQAFNRALSARKIEDATALMAKGSVQYTLRAAHPGVTATAPTGITSDLKTHWNTIGPVVFSVTTVYSRVPKILDTRIDGDLATVWAQVASETVAPDTVTGSMKANGVTRPVRPTFTRMSSRLVVASSCG